MGIVSGSRRSSPLPPDWPQIRKLVLQRDRGVCLWGLLPGETELDGIAPGECLILAREVDHMGAAWDHDPSKLRSICSDHHKRRTSRQANAARSAKLALQNGHFRSRPSRRHPGLRGQ